MINKSKKAIYLSFGIAFVILAFIGIFLPLIPTTPFLLLSAYFFSQSNEKYYQWLLDHKVFGQIITDWNKYGVVSVKSKIMAISMIVALFSYTLIYVEVNPTIKVIVSLIGVGVIVFLLTRPSKRKL
ncbi:PF04304 family protein [Bacteriovorax sp. BAL6_X]|uniref:YbaN family protein n=1 Tax=Bacteriovorax sp. BAL6_X TaxID=1201290 RepID=UPI000385D0EE|nr:YbaN family protein [Bacteriovorax sp. BAL6_X]EPZ51718.1 PF04304 family protein [Bacteriovorax sp. BAL6_X]